MNLKPDENVAAQIVADIKREKLIPPKKITLLKEKLASDGLDESDWILLADFSIDEEG